jgi:acetylornithine/N-succinyldiaminopimelate aminotransferase
MAHGAEHPDSSCRWNHRPRGEGSWLWDNQGRRYLDFIQGWAVNCLGHCPPVITQALADQSRLLISPSPAFHNEPAMRLAARIAEQSGLQRVFLTSTGAEANEGAIKLARKWGSLHRGGAYEIITFHTPFMAAPWPRCRPAASRSSSGCSSRRCRGFRRRA